MKRIAYALLIVLAACSGCKTPDGPFHDWKPPGMMMQGPAPVEKGRL